MTDSELKNALFHGHLRPQVAEDSFALSKILKSRPFKKVLEIGTGLGSTPIWEFLLEGDGLVVSVDINSRPIESVRPVVDPNLVKLIESNSLLPETVEKVKEYFGYGTVDFLFIDGEHGYPFMKPDYDNYSPFVKDGGIIALHDTNMAVEIFDGPKRVLQEAKDQGLRTDSIPNGLGIGIIFKEKMP